MQRKQRVRPNATQEEEGKTQRDATQRNATQEEGKTQRKR